MTTPQKRARVVVVDDDKKLLEMMKEALSDDYEVHTAAKPQDGLRIIEDLTPDVVILDVDMPEMDGFALCETIRDAGWVKYIPVIFITGHAGEAFAKDARKAGGDAFITKPFQFSHLVSTIEELRKAHK